VGGVEYLYVDLSRTFPGLKIRKSRAVPARAHSGSDFLRAKIFVAELLSFKTLKRHFSLTSHFPSSTTLHSSIVLSLLLDTMSDKINPKDKQIWGMPVRLTSQQLLLISISELQTALDCIALNRCSIALVS
jgi:hypothetical protein